MSTYPPLGLSVTNFMHPPLALIVVMKLIDLTGHRFGRLIVRERAGSSKKEALWLCVCDCGREVTTRGTRLRRGITRSCGCLAQEVSRETARKMGHKYGPLTGQPGPRTHGHHTNQGPTGTYNSWAGMKQRCNYPLHISYSNYGGRGIRVCERWESFPNFLADMGERPEGASIDRIDVDGNYEAGNCRWASSVEQRHNRRTTAS